MTLIITAISDKNVIQVSDRRLTLNDGSLHDDLAIKALCVSCADASFCMAYTGLAVVGSHRTDEWVVDYLSSINAGELGFVKLFEAFNTQVENTFNKLRLPKTMRGIAFAFAGFGPTGPFMAHLSNLEDEKGHRLRAVDDRFHAGFYFRNNKPMHKLDLMIHGADQAVDIIKPFIPEFRKRYLEKNAHQTAIALVQLIRKATEHPTVGHLIGRSCISSSVSLSGDFICDDHPEKPSQDEYMPHFISKNTAYKNVRIWVGEGSPSWWSGNKS